MKYLFFSFFIIALSCNQQKKETTKIKKTENKETIKEEKVENEEVIRTIVKTHENLIVVLKNPKNVNDAKALIENSSLIWDNLVIDKNSLKVAAIKVPIGKKDFWIERLKSSNIFSTVTHNKQSAINEINYLSENTFAKIRKSQCSGDCPVYELTLFKDGKVTFIGIENVLIKGKHDFTISEVKFKKIQDKFKKTSFGMYLDSYVDKSLVDYPSTFITHNDKQIEIKLWKNVPEELAFAFEALEDILFEKKLIE
ncbi:DUF6438 domain-containing protein [uncultured Polaribacter sp.]|uniref:DUF6438 domain-containing protein n=1 Tax=uncultured Polaribacter sp. TaxID=174711 RepID=UPI00259AFA21|nr:DUF6438 domain-containing protein [uncultured Polaribacter sp.]